MKRIEFGKYWQSNSAEKEPIEWLVLKENEDRMYLLSKYCLDCLPYTDGRKIAWKNSTIRHWLNGTFYNDAFSSEEKDRIILSDVRTESGGWFGPLLDEGTAVKDKVFLPSIAEAIIYFNSEKWHDIYAEQNRIARPTKYAFEKGCAVYPLSFKRIEFSFLYENEMRDSFDKTASYWQEDGSRVVCTNDNTLESDTRDKRWGCSWFLRSSGRFLIRVNSSGEIEDNSWSLRKMFFGNEGVRPAIWLKR